MLKAGPVIFFCFFTINCFADNLSVSRNLVYAEILGRGGYGSLNYERLILRQEFMSMGLSLGAGTYNVYDFEGRFNPDLILPFSLNFYFFEPHSIEVGIGSALSSIIQVDQANWQPERINRMSMNFALGYRYRKSEGGLVFGAGYKPVIEFYRRFVHWGGISFGYAF